MPVHGWRRRLFLELRSCESLAEGCRRVEVSRQSVYRLKRFKPEFAARLKAALQDMEYYKERMREERGAESQLAKELRLEADLKAFTAALVKSRGRVTKACHACGMVVSTVYRRALRLQEWQAVLDQYSIKQSRKD